MKRPMDVLMQSDVIKNALFPPNSRYYRFETLEMEGPDGRKVVYLQRRFVPMPERFELIQEHTVTEGERLDNITAHYLDDPELFWRLCDANRAMLPDELTRVVGRRLRITLPEGVPGAPDA